MRAKRFPLPATLVMLIGVSACDNVSFEGVQMELRPPPEPPGGVVVEDTLPEVEEEAPLLPVELGPLVYLVEVTQGASATILPVAEVTEDGYEAIPDEEEIDDLMERFAIGRWEAGVELSLVGHGGRIGTFIASGGTEPDGSTCRIRPRGAGRVELSPEVAGNRWFLARPEGEPVLEADSAAWPTTAGPPSGGASSTAGAEALNVAQRLIPALGIAWPPSIPGVREDLQPLGLPTTDGILDALAASHVFGGQLGPGTPSPNGYGFFFLAAEGDTRYDPLVSWYQRAESGKAYPRFLGMDRIRPVPGPDAVVEVFGESDRWLGILGPDEDGEWEMRFQDACGQEPARGAIQSYP